MCGIWRSSNHPRLDGVIIGKALYEGRIRARGGIGQCSLSASFPASTSKTAASSKESISSNLRDAGDPVECGLRYSEEGADELVFLDITASSDRRNIVAEMVRRVADSINIPFTVGGGLRNVDDIQEILRSGADKVSLNTSAVEDPSLVQKAAERFGSQCIVVAIDARRENGGSAKVYTHGGREPNGSAMPSNGRRPSPISAPAKFC